MAADPATVKRAIATLDVALAHGDRIDIRLEAAGLTIEDAQQTLVWRGDPRSVAFWSALRRISRPTRRSSRRAFTVGRFRSERSLFRCPSKAARPATLPRQPETSRTVIAALFCPIRQRTVPNFERAPGPAGGRPRILR